MFGFIHPKPFNSRAVAVQMVARKAAIIPDVGVLIVETPVRVAPAVAALTGPSETEEMKALEARSGIALPPTQPRPA